jgi:hypothetical protein
MRDILRTAAVISSFAFSIWMGAAEAQQEIKLSKSINVLADHPSGIEMIFKSWNNEHDGYDRFILTFFTRTTNALEHGTYYERVLSYADDKPVEFSLWEGADCSKSQTMVFRIPTQQGPRLAVGKAERIGVVNGKLIVSQADPAPQHIRIFVPKVGTEDDYGKSSVWLDAAAETRTRQRLCTVEEVRREIRLFFSEHMAELASKQ